MIGNLSVWLPTERWMAFSIWLSGSLKVTPQAVCQKFTALGGIVEYPMTQFVYVYLSIYLSQSKNSPVHV
jgi:hypothetical protein